MEDLLFDSGLFDPAQYASLRKPLAEASTLPPHCYTSAEFFAQEIETVFLKHWQFVGRIEQVAKIGDYFCYPGHGGSVIICKDDRGGINAFANSCRHRGSELLSGDGNCKHIRCPYHSWAYRLDGELMSAPQMSEVDAFNPIDFPLLPIALEIWDGFIFINYKANPPPLTTHLGNLPEHFASHRCSELKLAGQLHFEIDANWKLLAENALEAYHTGSVHRDTLGPQESSAVDHRGNWTGLLVEDETSVATMVGDDKPFEHIAGLDADARKGAYFTLVYPSTQIVFAQDCCWWLAFKPIAVDKTQLSIGACFPASTLARKDFDQMAQPYFERWRLATAEDNTICEAQQRGQAFDRPPGRFAPAEFAVHQFSNWIIDQVLA